MTGGTENNKFDKLSHNTYLIQFLAKNIFNIDNKKNKDISETLFNITFSNYKKNKFGILEKDDVKEIKKNMDCFNDNFKNNNDTNRYFENIKDYLRIINKNLDIDEKINLTYYQFFWLIMSEYYLDNYFNNKDIFIKEFKDFIKEKNNLKINNDELNDILDNWNYNKLVYWMATWSWKTIIMAINILQALEYNKKYDNIIIITPSEDLSEQHKNELQRLNIISYIKDKYDKEIIFLENTKLAEDWYTNKKNNNKGKIDVFTEYGDTNNLVFVDEWHQWVWSKQEEDWWIQKQRRDTIWLKKDSFIFEYSATYAQEIWKLKNNYEKAFEYYSSIIWNYSYKFFYSDGYWKDLRIQNTNKQRWDEDKKEKNIIEALINYSEKNRNFKELSEENIKKYNIEKPLLAIFGNTIRNRNTDKSDINFFIEILWKIINNDKSLDIDEKTRNNILKDFFEIEIKENEIYKNKLELVKLENGEIWVKVEWKWKENYIWLIYIWSPDAILDNFKDEKNLNVTIMKEKELEKKLNLFNKINDWTLNFIIWAKKFTTWWNTYRITNMLLLNVWKWQWPVIIQILWRWVRIKWKDFSLKRTTNNDEINKIYTLDVIWFNSKYLTTFVKEVKEETWIDLNKKNILEIDYTNILEIEIDDEEIKKIIKIPTIKKEEITDIFDFNDIKINDNEIIKSLNYIIYNSSYKKIEYSMEDNDTINKQIHDYIFKKEDFKLNKTNWFNLYLEILENKNESPYLNFIIINYDKFKDLTFVLLKSEIDKKPLFKIILWDKNDITNKDIQKEIIKNLWFKVFKWIYNYKQTEINFKNLSFEEPKIDYNNEEPKIDDDNTFKSNEHRKLFSINEKIYITYTKDSKIANNIENKFKNLDNNLYIFDENLEKKKIKLPTTLNLVMPLIWIKDDDLKEIKEKDNLFNINPPVLNDWEIDFVEKIGEYIEWKDDNKYDFFLLRNNSRSWLGLFLEDSWNNFYPDFILWKVYKEDKNEQKIYFIDPKWLHNLDIEDDKVIIHGKLKELEKDKVKITSYLYKTWWKGREWHNLDNHIITSEDDFKKIFEEETKEK